MADPTINVLRPGDTTKDNPFTICIVSNPALETPYDSGQFAIDPIVNDEMGFNDSCGHIVNVLFGELPNQREALLKEPSIADKIRVLSIFITGLPATNDNALVGQHSIAAMLVTRRSIFKDFLALFDITADVVYAVSDSQTHLRASAWYSSDDDASPGEAFTINGVQRFHRHFCRIPGSVAIHRSNRAMTALHEFGHAISSFENGKIVDLYTDGDVGINKRRARPIPDVFAVYDGVQFASDSQRDGLGYPQAWDSYHCEVFDATLPSLMDDYRQAPDGQSVNCQYDKITRQFLLDRVRVKTNR